MKEETVRRVYIIFIFAAFIAAIVLFVIDFGNFYVNAANPTFGQAFLASLMEQSIIHYYLGYSSLFIFAAWIGLTIYIATAESELNRLQRVGVSLFAFSFFSFLAWFGPSQGVVISYVVFVTMYINSFSTGVDGFQKGMKSGIENLAAPLIVFSSLIYHSVQSFAFNPDKYWLDNLLASYIPIPHLVYWIFAFTLIASMGYTTIKTAKELKETYSRVAVIYNPLFLVLFAVTLTIIDPNLPFLFYQVELALCFMVGWISGTGIRRAGAGEIS